MVSRIVGAAALLAGALAVHTAANLRHLRRPAAPVDPIHERVSILIPARDEAATVEATVRSALAQRGLASFEVIVLDDGSSDATAAIVRGIDDPRLRLEQGADEPPPAGWLGKPWACERLAELATGSVMVFVDADVTLRPDAVAACVAELRRDGFALIAPYPQQLSVSPLAGLVQPLMVWSWVATIPLGIAERSPRPSLSAANGQLLVLDAVAYHRAGGHGSVAGQVLEDIGIMRAIKASGGTAATVDGSTLAECRMYETDAQLVDGYAKSLWAAFGGPVGSVAVNSALAGLYVLPACAAVTARDPRARALGALGYAAGVASRALVARRTGEPLAQAFAHPVAISAFIALNAVSWTRHRRGANLWKGRPVA